jgi:hypothetical protein
MCPDALHKLLIVVVFGTNDMLQELDKAENLKKDTSQTPDVSSERVVPTVQIDLRCRKWNRSRSVVAVNHCIFWHGLRNIEVNDLELHRALDLSAYDVLRFDIPVCDMSIQVHVGQALDQL